MTTRRGKPTCLTVAKRRMLVSVLKSQIIRLEVARDSRLDFKPNPLDCSDLDRKIAAYRELIDDLSK
jgi:hypothetical protein